MAIFGDPRDLRDPTARGDEARRERKRLFGDAQAKLSGDALVQGAQLLQVFTLLPAAVLAVERDEYERIVKRYDRSHPRARALERSIAQLAQMEEHAARGRTRVTRLLDAARRGGQAFHGFVSGPDGEPWPNLTVRIEDPRATQGDNLSARTGDDGYFRIELPRAKVTVARKKSRAAAEDPAPAAATAEAAAAAEQLAEVRIHSARGQLLHVDPVQLRLDDGGAYREYLIDERDGVGKPVAAKPARARKRKAR